jgi:hypothetical protein
MMIHQGVAEMAKYVEVMVTLVDRAMDNPALVLATGGGNEGQHFLELNLQGRQWIPIPIPWHGALVLCH